MLSFCNDTLGVEDLERKTGFKRNTLLLQYSICELHTKSPLGSSFLPLELFVDRRHGVRRSSARPQLFFPLRYSFDSRLAGKTSQQSPSCPATITTITVMAVTAMENTIIPTISLLPSSPFSTPRSTLAQSTPSTVLVL